MENNTQKFRKFLFSFWLWNIFLDLITLAFAIYLFSLFPDTEKAIFHLYKTLIVVGITFLRLLIILIFSIIKLVRKNYVQFFCLLGEFIFLLFILLGLLWLLAFVMAGATGAAGLK